VERTVQQQELAVEVVVCCAELQIDGLVEQWQQVGILRRWPMAGKGRRSRDIYAWNNTNTADCGPRVVYFDGERRRAMNTRTVPVGCCKDTLSRPLGLGKQASLAPGIEEAE